MYLALHGIYSRCKFTRSSFIKQWKTIRTNIHVLHVLHVKGMEHVPNIFMSFDKYLFLEVINILI